MLRLPTPATLRKLAHADDEAIANTDPKAAKKFGKEKVKLVSFNNVSRATRLFIVLRSTVAVRSTNGMEWKDTCVFSVVDALIPLLGISSVRLSLLLSRGASTKSQVHKMVDENWHWYEDQANALLDYFKVSHGDANVVWVALFVVFWTPRGMNDWVNQCALQQNSPLQVSDAFLSSCNEGSKVESFEHNRKKRT